MNGVCTLSTLTCPRFESVFFASFLCRFGQRNDVPPRTVANSDEEKIRLMQTAKAESSDPASTLSANPGTKHPNTAPTANPQSRAPPKPNPECERNSHQLPHSRRRIGGMRAGRAPVRRPRQDRLPD